MRLLVSVGARSVVVPLADVSLIEADGNYVGVTTSSTKYTLRESLRELEGRLNAQQFVRVYRSAIVRISAVAGVERIDYERVAIVHANSHQSRAQGRGGTQFGEYSGLGL